MKVFEVITEHCKDDNKEVIKTVQYVTSKENSLLSVVEHYTSHCYEYEKDLISVRDVLTVTAQTK